MLSFQWPLTCGKYYPTCSLSRHNNASGPGLAPCPDDYPGGSSGSGTDGPGAQREPTWPLRGPWPSTHSTSAPAHNVNTFTSHFHSSARVKPGRGKKSTVHAGEKTRLGCIMKPQNMLVFSAVVSDMKHAALNLFSPNPNQSCPTWALLWLHFQCVCPAATLDPLRREKSRVCCALYFIQLVFFYLFPWKWLFIPITSYCLKLTINSDINSYLTDTILVFL